MAQTGYTPISIYYSATTTNVPTAGNLVAGELAINTADGKLFYKDSAGVVQTIATKNGIAGGSNTQVQYNSSGSLAGSANMTFNGTSLTLANDASISGLTVGKGAGADIYSTAFGVSSLGSASSGVSNTALGRFTLSALTTGSSNTAVGRATLANLTTGSYNVGLGDFALNSAISANYSTAIGYQSAYLSNISGTSANTSVGALSLYSNTTGTNNTASGMAALYSNTTGAYNTAIGRDALQANTTASNNTAVGYQALYSNTTGPSITAVGWKAGYSNTASQECTYIGTQAGFNATGAYNTCVGAFAGYGLTTGVGNTFIGPSGTGNGSSGQLITTGSYNSILGAYNGNAGGLDIRTASNYIVLSDGAGNPRIVVNAYGKVLIGQTASLDGAGATAAQLEVTQTGDNDIFYLTNSNATAPYGINIKYSAASPNGSTQNFLYCADSTTSRAYIRSNGGLSNYSANNTNLSDQREKKNIELAGNYLDKICAIPVKTFLYNDQTDEDLNLGVIAQDVQAVAPELVNESNWADKNEPEKLRLSIYQTDLQYALMKAIQELKAEFDAYKATHP
jgi:hypothetical protein